MSSYMKTIIYGKLHQNLRGAVHLLCQMRWIDPHIFCALCAKHVDRLKAIRNYSPAFINGLVGSALKKDNVAKHKKFDMHGKAVNMELQSTRTVNSILTSTPLGKTIDIRVEGLETEQVSH